MRSVKPTGTILSYIALGESDHISGATTPLTASRSHNNKDLKLSMLSKIKLKPTSKFNALLFL